MHWTAWTTSLIKDRRTFKRPLCAERRWHLPLRCDIGTASSVAWVNGALGRLQFCRPHTSWAAWCPLITPISEMTYTVSGGALNYLIESTPIFADPSWLPPRTVSPFHPPFTNPLGTAKWFVSNVPRYLCRRPTSKSRWFYNKNLVETLKAL